MEDPLCHLSQQSKAENLVEARPKQTVGVRSESGFIRVIVEQYSLQLPGQSQPLAADERLGRWLPACMAVLEW